MGSHELATREGITRAASLERFRKQLTNKNLGCARRFTALAHNELAWGWRGATRL